MAHRPLAAAATALLLSSAPSAAQDATYVSGSVGYTFGETFGSNVGVEATIKDGYAVTGAVGRSFGPVRGEIEGSYRGSDVGEARGLGLVARGSGNVSALSAMANIYFDPAFALGPLQPYVGGGIGVSRFRAEDVAAAGVAGLGPVSGSETGFAWQLMAGVGFAVSEAATLTAGYRYFATPDVEVDVAPLGSVNVDGLGLHAAEVGLRFRF
jgi:opacity protein-like surface antigen